MNRKSPAKITVSRKKDESLLSPIGNTSTLTLPPYEIKTSPAIPKVSVIVEPKFSNEHSEANRGRFVFLYNITINIEGKLGAQLLSRYWKITSADGDIQEVRGEGVIGEQPLIMPKEPYQYESYCILPTPLGWVEGEYQMVDDEGRFFNVPVSRFRLAMPGIVQ